MYDASRIETPSRLSVDGITGLYLNFYFYSASAWLAMQSAVLAIAIPSVRPSVCLSVRHTSVSCPDEWRYDRAVFSIW